MKRRVFLTCGAAALAVSARAAFASTYGDEVVAQLTKQGFSQITVETTWLGRERITAERADGLREIILNPRTGEILRDTWTAQSGATRTRPIVDEVGGGSGKDDGKGSGDDGGNDGSSGSDGSGDHSGHDGSDDSGGDDHSGSGSGGSDDKNDDSGDDKGGDSGGGGKDDGGGDKK